MNKQVYMGMGWFVSYYYIKSKNFMPHLKLTVATKDLLMLIHNLDRSNDHCFATIKFMADAIGVDPTTIQGGLKRLIEVKLISEKKIGDKWRYTSHLPTEDELLKSNQGNKNQLLVDENKLLDGVNQNDKHLLVDDKSKLLVDKKKLIDGVNQLSSAHIYNINIKDNIIKNKKDINSSLHSKAETILSKISKKKQNIIIDIYEFWNTFNESGVWHSHRKLTPDMVTVIIDNLKSYTMDDICTAIYNYAIVLQGDNYWWDYIWPLSAFLSVKDSKNKDAYKKWWRFLPENFVESNYRNKNQNGKTFYKRNTTAQQDKLLKDPIPSLTKKLIQAHSRFTPRGWEPSVIEHNKFIQVALKAQKQVNNIKESWVQDNLILDLLGALTLHYSDKGQVISPGHYSSDFTWDTLLYQYIVGQGVNPGNLFNYIKGGDEYFDAAVIEEEELSGSIQRNINKQNPEVNKSVNDMDNPEFDYMLEI